VAARRSREAHREPLKGTVELRSRWGVTSHCPLGLVAYGVS
jgi:hypothetical protein